MSKNISSLMIQCIDARQHPVSLDNLKYRFKRREERGREEKKKINRLLCASPTEVHNSKTTQWTERLRWIVAFVGAKS